MTLLLAMCLAAAPASAPAPQPMKPIDAPLGDITKALTDEQPGGSDSADPFVLQTFQGCTRAQAVYPLRYVTGTMEAVRTVDAWLRAQPELEKKLFGKKHLVDLVAHVEKGVLDGKSKACEAPAFPYAPEKAPKLCAEGSPVEHWLKTKNKPSAVVRAFDSGVGTRDVCLPRVSVVLFDEAGKARFQFQADYGAALSVTVLGERCQGLDFTFDKAVQQFNASHRPAPKGCKG